MTHSTTDTDANDWINVDELLKPSISDYLDKYYEQHDAVLQLAQMLVNKFIDLNETVEQGDLEVTPRDVEIVKAKLQEVESKFSVFREAGYETFAITGFPSIRK